MNKINRTLLIYTGLILLSVSVPASNISIDTIAFDAGFNDRSHFYRVFRKMTGLSPGDFLKNVERNS